MVPASGECDVRGYSRRQAPLLYLGARKNLADCIGFITPVANHRAPMIQLIWSRSSSSSLFHGAKCLKTLKTPYEKEYFYANSPFVRTTTPLLLHTPTQMSCVLIVPYGVPLFAVDATRPWRCCRTRGGGALLGFEAASGVRAQSHLLKERAPVFSHHGVPPALPHCQLHSPLVPSKEHPRPESMVGAPA